MAPGPRTRRHAQQVTSMDTPLSQHQLHRSGPASKPHAQRSVAAPADMPRTKQLYQTSKQALGPTDRPDWSPTSPAHPRAQLQHLEGPSAKLASWQSTMPMTIPWPDHVSAMLSALLQGFKVAISSHKKRKEGLVRLGRWKERALKA